MNNNELMILNQYPADKYNSLIPIASAQEPSDMHKIIVNQVLLNPDVDAYPQSGKLALNKGAILKLMAAANIQMVSSEAVQPQSIKDAIEMAKAIGKAVDYDKRDTAHKVVVRVPDTNGGHRTLEGTKELIAEEILEECRDNAKNGKYTKDKSPAVQEEKAQKDFKQIMKFRRPLAETKALLRALRSALMLKATYTRAELQKPFIVAIVVPNAENEIVKKAIAANFERTNSLMFGTSSEPLAIGHDVDNDAEQMPETPVDDVIISDVDMPDVLGDELPEEMAHKFCDNKGCGQEIKAYGKNSVQDIVDRSQQMFGKDYCFTCLKEKASQK